jgi:hypothetical protein
MTNSDDMPLPYDRVSPGDKASEHGKASDAPPASLLDEDRVASMADEGGVSGALMEIDDPGERKHLMQTLRRRRIQAWRKTAAVVAVLGLAMFALGWLRRNA